MSEFAQGERVRIPSREAFGIRLVQLLPPLPDGRPPRRQRKDGAKREWSPDWFIRAGTNFIRDAYPGPFFLYFATHDIHVPRVPNQRFVGKTGMGPRGDAIVSFDDSVRRVMETLEKLNLVSNTIVILSSDNGPVLDDGYADGAVEKLGDHRPAGPLRGGKYSVFEGGTRTPFITRWSGRIRPTVSDEVVSTIDFCS